MHATPYVLFVAGILSAQPRESDDVLTPITANDQSDAPCAGLDGNRAVPPAVGHRGDGWPRKLNGRGVVTAISPNTCSGFACDQALVTIRISTSHRRYRADTLYGFKSCVNISDVPTYCNRMVRFKAKKIVAGSEPCGLRPSFNSSGVPHYEVEQWELTDAE
jgi:hypothetical protein